MEVLNLCIGRKYKTRDNMQNEVEKTAWTRIGTMFIRTDEKTGQPRYSMLFDAYPAHGESIAAFPKQERDNQGQSQGSYQPAQDTRTAAEEAATAPVEKEDEEVKIEDVPF